MNVAARSPRHKCTAERCQVHSFGLHVRFALNAVGDVQCIGANLVAQTAAVVIVCINHGAEAFVALRVLGHFAKKPRLRLVIIFHIRMEVEVILS